MPRVAAEAQPRSSIGVVEPLLRRNLAAQLDSNEQMGESTNKQIDESINKSNRLI
jgi:hypothetical protein